jgi:hypothetical protein
MEKSVNEQIIVPLPSSKPRTELGMGGSGGGTGASWIRIQPTAAKIDGCHWWFRDKWSLYGYGLMF